MYTGEGRSFKRPATIFRQLRTRSKSSSVPVFPAIHCSVMAAATPLVGATDSKRAASATVMVAWGAKPGAGKAVSRFVSSRSARKPRVEYFHERH